VSYRRATELDPTNGEGWLQLSFLYRRKGNYVYSQQAAEQAAKVATLNKNFALEASSAETLAVLSDLLGHRDSATRLYERALQLHDRTAPNDKVVRLRILQKFAAFQRKSNKLADSLVLYRKVISLQQKILGKSAPDVLATAEIIGDIYADTGEYEDAKNMYQGVLVQQERILDADHPKVAVILGKISNLSNIINEVANSEQRIEITFEDALPEGLAIGEHISINGLQLPVQAVDDHRRKVVLLGATPNTNSGVNVIDIARKRFLYWLEQNMLRRFKEPYSNSYAIVAAIDDYEQTGYRQLGGMVRGAKELIEVLKITGFPSQNIFPYFMRKQRLTRLQTPCIYSGRASDMQMQIDFYSILVAMAMQ
jgi:tetratricopeptide (TPR) repeat protein